MNLITFNNDNMNSRQYKIFGLLILSTVVYALNGTLEYILLKHFELYTFFFLWSFGGVLSLPLLVHIMGMRNDLFKNLKGHIVSIAGGSFLVICDLSLFMAFKLYFLASVYPLIAVSSLIFFVIDLVKYHSKLSSRVIVFIMIGIILVIIGTLLTESINYSFNYSILPFAIAIIVFAGLGYYAVFYNIHEYSIGSKISSITIISFITSIVLLFILPPDKIIYQVQSVYSIMVVISGMLFITALALELKVVKITENVTLYKTVALKNLINNFTYLDTVLVLLLSVVIGSFVPIEILGGFIIVFGVVIIAKADEKEGRGNS